ncbi:MAG: hypothetical protein CK532_03530 [Flavobacteriales bacterium]|nr:MAG: hypothetical protein CK532_03530 [Flavobacteriales bacterium]
MLDVQTLTNKTQQQINLGKSTLISIHFLNGNKFRANSPRKQHVGLLFYWLFCFWFYPSDAALLKTVNELDALSRWGDVGRPMP